MSRPALAAVEPLTIGAPAPLFAATVTVIALAGAAAVAPADAPAWSGEGAALAVFAAAGTVLAVGAAGFRGWTHALVLLLLALGTTLDDLARAAGPAALVGGPPLVVVPLLLLTLGVLRPPAEVLGGGLLLALVSAAAAATIGPGGAPAAALAAAAATSVAAPALAAWALGRVALARLVVAEGGTAPGLAPVRLSVQQQTVAHLEAEALPLLERVLERGTIAPGDAERAAGIAARLRAALLTDLARGWLAEAGVAAEDPDGYAERMTTGQRTALRALLAAVPPPRRPARAVVAGQDHDAQLVLELPGVRRRDADPLLPLLHAAFVTAGLESRSDGVRLTATWSTRG